MKKIILGFLSLVLISSSAIAQLDDTENNVKNFRFGLKIDPSINWLSPDNKKKFESDGSGVGFGWGLQMEFRLNEITSLATGLNLSYEQGNINFINTSSADSTYYLLNNDDEFQSLDDTANWSKSDLYLLNSRKYKFSYVNIPFAIKMKTKEIGYLTYFGQFGGNIGVKTRTRVTDQAELQSNTGFTDKENKDLDLGNGAAPVRIGLSIGGGAEYNFSGSTSLTFGISYDHYFTNSIKKDDEFLRKADADADNGIAPIEQKALARGIRLSIGILF